MCLNVFINTNFAFINTNFVFITNKCQFPRRFSLQMVAPLPLTLCGIFSWELAELPWGIELEHEVLGVMTVGLNLPWATELQH